MLNKIPWQITWIAAFVVYVVINILGWLEPCQSTSMTIGLCGAGKILMSVLSVTALLILGAIALLLRYFTGRNFQPPKSSQFLNTWVLLFGLAFIAAPIFIALLLRFNR